MFHINGFSGWNIDFPFGSTVCCPPCEKVKRQPNDTRIRTKKTKNGGRHL